MIRAFLFDLDETLVDCEDQHEAATRAMLDALEVPHGRRVDLFHEDGTGMSTLDLVEAYRARLGLAPSLDELLALRHAAFLAALDAQPAAPMPGARELLTACQAIGPLALVTNGHRDDALASLESAALAPFFATLVTAEDAPSPKPAPDPYRIACARLGVPPRDALAFEDSARGVASAGGAGCAVVAVPNARSTRRDAVADADLVLGSLAEALPLDALLARLRGA